MSLDEFLKSGKYLPKPLRDFHDQKDIFKMLGRVVDNRKDSMYKLPQWTEAMLYTIDIFLWVMAKCGWTLQRSRQNVEFCDLEESVKQFKDEEFEKFKEEMRVMHERYTRRETESVNDTTNAG